MIFNSVLLFNIGLKATQNTYLLVLIAMTCFSFLTYIRLIHENQTFSHKMIWNLAEIVRDVTSLNFNVFSRKFGENLVSKKYHIV